MNCKDFRWHIRNALIKQKYFYIPRLRHEQSAAVYLKFNYDTGGDVYISEVRLVYYTYQLVHDFIYDESGAIAGVKTDEYPKGYAFETDLEWRFPVPDPSQWEIYPVPDLTQYDISVPGGTVTKRSQSAVDITFLQPQTLVEIRGLPAGIYNVSPTMPESVMGWTYYPDYYNGYDNTRKPDHYVGLGMIDRNGLFSGYHSASVSDALGNGYAVSCATTKFTENTMPIVGERIHNIRWVICWIDVPGMTGVKMQKDFSRDPTYYVFIKPDGSDANSVCRGLDFVSNYITNGKLLGAKIYDEGDYKGTIGLGNIWSNHTDARTTSIEIDRVINWGVTDIKLGSGDVPAYNWVASISLDRQRGGRSHTGSYYLDFTESDIAAATVGGRNNIKEWADGCSKIQANDMWGFVRDNPDDYSGYPFQLDDLIYEDDYYNESRSSLKSASKSGSNIQIVSSSTSIRYQSGYLVSQTPRYPDIGVNDYTVGSYVYGLAEVPNDDQTNTITESSLATIINDGEKWTGVVPDEADHMYYYINGMTEAEALRYISLLSNSGTTVEIEEE